eukprot:scaffold24608_cov202-Isochrysis_galbana.AAC.1
MARLDGHRAVSVEATAGHRAARGVGRGAERGAPRARAERTARGGSYQPIRRVFFLYTLILCDVY